MRSDGSGVKTPNPYGSRRTISCGASERSEADWHAVIWIAAYVGLTNIGDGLSELIGEPNSATVPLLVLLSVGLVL